MSAIELCRTAALGGHFEACEDCSHSRAAYNSCGNRHCPKCQTTTREQWLADRQADLLPPDADVSEVAREIRRVVETPAGRRPFRVHVDPSKDGSEVVSAVADRIRADFFRRVGIEDLLTTGSAL